MNISHSWLKRYLKFDLDAVETGELLTEIGLETEKIHSIGGLPGGLKGVVVGKILSCEQHPNADRLKVTQVDVGADAPLAIVCGAPNATAGQTVLVATVGCTLHPTKELVASFDVLTFRLGTAPLQRAYGRNHVDTSMRGICHCAEQCHEQLV